MNSPPQTYSRLFRPWDGVGSKPASPIHQVSSHPFAERKSLDHVVTKSDLQEMVRINERIMDPAHYHLASAQPFLNPAHFASQDAFAFLAAHGLPTTYGNPSVAGPMDAMLNASMFNPIEQEYARIMAEEAETRNMNARKQRPKKYKCPHCNVAFSNNGQLKGHVRIHTGRFPSFI